MVAYRLMPAHWGTGLATEAALVSIRYGFDNLGLKQIIRLTMLENIASIRVLEKIDLRRIGAVPILRTRLFKVCHQR